MRLFCRVHDGGIAFRLYGCKHDVNRCPNRNLIEVNIAAYQLRCLGHQAPILLAHICAQRSNSLFVQVNRPLANGAASGQIYLCAQKAPQQRPHKVIGGAHAPHQIDADIARIDAARIDGNRTIFSGIYLCA